MARKKAKTQPAGCLQDPYAYLALAIIQRAQEDIWQPQPEKRDAARLFFHSEWYAALAEYVCLSLGWQLPDGALPKGVASFCK